MAQKTPRPGQGQVGIEGIAESVPVERDLTKRNLFAQVATPEYLGLKLELYADVTPAMIAAANPEKLRSSLVDVRRNNSPLTVGYTPEGGSSERYVALFPYEYRLVLRTRTADNLSNLAMATTLTGKKSLLPTPEQRHQVAEQEGYRAVQEKYKGLMHHVNASLRPELGSLLRLLEAAQHPGLLRRKENDTRVAVAAVRDWMLPQVLEAIGLARGWTNDQYVMARKAIDVLLFMTRDHNQHLRNWVAMLQLLRDYDQAKIELFLDRAGRARGFLVQHGIDPETAS